MAIYAAKFNCLAMSLFYLIVWNSTKTSVFQLDFEGILLIYSGNESFPPIIVLHGTLHYTNPLLENGEYPINTTVTITCNEGYVEGNPGASKVCTTAGVIWRGNYRLICLRKKSNKL